MDRRRVRVNVLSMLVSAAITALSVGALVGVKPVLAGTEDPDDLLIVDCLLPGKLRRLGTMATFISARRPVKTSAKDCRIRGGEYTAYDRANYTSALRVWLELANQNDPVAQTYVGEIYEKGLGVPPEFQLAANWYRKAAEQGYSRAQINLGQLYEQGLGVPKDQKQAVYWFRKASGLGESNIDYQPMAPEQTEAYQRLKEERDRYKEKAENLERILDQSKSKLQGAEAALRREKAAEKEAAAQLQKLRGQLAVAQQTTEPDPADVKRIRELESQLSARTEEATLHRLKAERLADEVSSYRKDYDDLSRVHDQSRQAADSRQQAQNARLSAAEREIQRLKREQSALEGLLASSRGRVSDAEQAIRRSRDKEAEIAGEVSRLNRALQEARQQADRGTEQQNKVRELELQLTQRNAEASAQQQEARRLADDIARYKREMDDLRLTQQQMLQAQKSRAQRDDGKLQQAEQEIARLRRELEAARQAPQAQVTAAPGDPDIAIIDPPLVTTRSGGALRAATSSVGPRTLIGRASDSDGILSVLINGKEYPVNEQGVFRGEVQIMSRETPIKVVAIDNAGQRSELAFTIDYKGADAAKMTGNDSAAALSGKDYGIDFGKFHALVIGNNNYLNLPKLNTAVNDAKAVASMLKDRFGFQVTLLIDADRYQILSALNKLRADLTDEDNLLVYYAGHGELDRVNDRGHWLPVDAEQTSSANWISNVAITDILNASSARHILVVADSCYSGSLTRAAIATLESSKTDEVRRKWLEVMSTKRSRLVLSSGGVAPVLDSGGGKHSVFARAFLDVLGKMDGVVETQRIYLQVSSTVGAVAADIGVEQLPQFAPIKFAGHEAGDFFFVAAGS